MTNNNTTYKNTAIGFIPSDWEVKKIKEIGDVSSGGTPDTTKVRYWNGDINWCTPTDITGLKNKFLGDTKTKITEEGLKSSSAKILPPFSIIVCTRATIGKAAINTVPMSTNQGFKNIIPKNIDTDFLYYKILSKEKGLIKIANGSTFLEVSKTDFDNFHIAVPPLPEQQKIASILSTWDTAIDNCKLIIEALKVRNKGLLNKLIIDNGELKVKLGEIFNESKIPVVNSDVNKRITVRLSLKGIEKRSVRGSEIEDATSYFKRRSGQFIYGKQNLHKGAFGIIPLELDGFESSSDIPAFDVNERFNIKYILYYFSRVHFYEKLEDISTGTGSKRIQPRELFKIIIKIPTTIEKQNKIVEILDRASEELTHYQQKLETLQLQKKGLMQQLLTGKVRVKI